MFIPYSCQQITDEDVAAVTAALRSEFLTQGPTVAAFEQAFATHHQAVHAIAVSSATAALHLGCLALGVGPTAMVWTTPNTFLASANCALYCGAQVDFVDMDPVSRNISTQALRDKLKAAEAAGKLPTVVIPVDFSGLPCDMQEIRHLADQYGFHILEDASHATGASYLGKPVGSAWADLTVFSLHAVKIVTTAEGGVITTQNHELAERLRLLRTHGMIRDHALLENEPEGPWYYEQQALGYNYRLTDLQAALGISQLARIDKLQEQRSALADRYDSLLSHMPLRCPPRFSDRKSAWHLYAIELDEHSNTPTRLNIFNQLRKNNIGVNVHYIPVHLQPYYTRMGFKKGDFPAAEAYYQRTLSLPLFPALTHAQQDHVVHALSAALGESL